MPGPPPKNPLTRQRVNRKPTASALGSASAATYRPLPERDDGQPWHPQATTLWAEAWRSPMAAEYVEADIPGLLVVIDLTHMYWHKPNAQTAGELRQERIAYGLDPMARRRLQWEIQKVEAVTHKPEPSTPARKHDPRLRLVAPTG